MIKRKKTMFVVTLVVVFCNAVAAISPPSFVDELLIEASREILPNDNTTVCNITVTPLNNAGEAIDAIVWFSSSLEGTYLNGEAHPPGEEIAVPTYNKKASVSLTADSIIGDTTIQIICGGIHRSIKIQIIEAPDNPPSPPPSYTIELKAGWNLICLPLNTTYTTAEELGQAIGADTVAKWNAELQQWVAHPVGGPGDFPLEAGYSYFIHVMHDITLTIVGLPYEKISVHLLPGINAIGWLSEESTTAEELGQTIINCSYISKWDPINQRWISHPVGGPGDFAITKGMGLLVFVTSSSTWEYLI